jgi:anthraniloyl-CoA monooxygenase
MTNARHLRGSAWLNFQRVVCEQWWLENRHGSHVVLMGDAVHTAHFAIGSGTKLAFEDAIELVRPVPCRRHGDRDLPAVLRALPGAAQRRDAAPAERGLERDGVVRGLRRALLRPARARAVHVLACSPAASASATRTCACATRPGSRATSAGSPRARRAAAQPGAAGRPADVHAVQRCAGDAEEPRRRLADGAVLGGRRRARRLPPGAPGRARDGRRRPGVGRDDLHEPRRPHHPRLPRPVDRRTGRRLGRIVDWVHANSDAGIGGADRPRRRQGVDPRHGTGTASTGRCPRRRRAELAAAVASPQQYLDGREPGLARDDTRRHGPREGRLRRRHPPRRASRLRLAGAALRARLPAVELHLAADQPARPTPTAAVARQPPALPAGGVRRGARRLAGDDLPMSVRISAHDWVEGGITPADAVAIARAFKAAGADLIDCSSGQVSKREKITFGRMFQTPFADRVRQEAGIATIAVGAISEADHVNSHHRRRPRRPVRGRAPAPGQPGLDADRGGAHRLHRTGLAACLPDRPRRSWRRTSRGSAGGQGRVMKNDARPRHGQRKDRALQQDDRA